MPANSHEATDKQVARAGAAKQKEPSPPQADGRPRQGAVDSCPSRVTDAGLGCLGVGLFIFVRKRKKKKKRIGKSAPVLVQQGPALVGTR